MRSLPFTQSFPLKLYSKSCIKFHEAIGEGISVVYRGEINGRLCAIKKYIYDDLKSIDDFYNWVRMYDSIKQSNPSIVIDIYGYSFHIISKDHIIVYIFMKLNESRDIYNYISDNNNWKPSIKYNNQYIPKFSSDYVSYDRNDGLYWCFVKDKHEQLIIINELINTIKQLHNTNHIHGDLKPNNVLWDTKKQKCVLIDFDSILSLSDQYIVKSNKLFCTMGYAPPEHYNYISGYSTDIYSLGVSIIEIWCGSIWKSKSKSYKDHRNDVLRNLRLIEKNEPVLGKILRQCVSPNYKKRPTIHKVCSIVSNIEISLSSTGSSTGSRPSTGSGTR